MFFRIYFWLEFTPRKAERPLQAVENQEKEQDKVKPKTGKMVWKNLKKKGAH